MLDQARIIQDYPIGNDLDSFRAFFRAVCTDKGTPCTSDAFGQLDLEDAQSITLSLLAALLGLKAPLRLRSRGNDKKNLLVSDLSRLAEANNLGNFDTNRIKPLLNAILSDHPGDALIWDRVYDAVPESTPPPQPIAFSQPSKRDCGRPIYKAGSPKVLLAALADCIEEHESLWLKAELLHRNISVGNLMISKDNGGFLIDSDLAINKERLAASGAKGKTGTRVFMASGALLGEQHSFMHDLESFFWVLFWICIHYDNHGNGRVVEPFDGWNYLDTENLGYAKMGRISNHRFTRTMEEDFTPHYKELAQCVKKLRKVVFPNGRNWKTENTKLYAQMKGILREASISV
ncbi:hypothetical protein RB593_008070 [Gaeumannomyces tritici]